MQKRNYSLNYDYPSLAFRITRLLPFRGEGRHDRYDTVFQIPGRGVQKAANCLVRRRARGLPDIIWYGTQVGSWYITHAGLFFLCSLATVRYSTRNREKIIRY